METNEKPKVKIYTDGACSGNPGLGGYGIILIYKTKENKTVTKEFSKGYKHTTNNRMELMAVIEALNLLKKPCEIELYSDSKYVIEAINKGWLDGWIANNWKNSSKKPVKNIDLWEKYLIAKKDHDIKFIWVKGHNENKFNEKCDKMAVLARSSNELEEDTGYMP